ncbi:hypothetical protein VPG91_05705 [Nitrospirillum amazonense]|uniref:hypothetical protein n=1 Tax=Nitrospirillum amazonense TaxID=28077 RepID=UPI0016480CD7|nr:hypothetical protein [Nitrospirillum amazonense]MEC4590473.1 hypothetical protein [Nitrospirillum amazonense]
MFKSLAPLAAPDDQTGICRRFVVVSSCGVHRVDGQTSNRSSHRRQVSFFVFVHFFKSTSAPQIPTKPSWDYSKQFNKLKAAHFGHLQIIAFATKPILLADAALDVFTFQRTMSPLLATPNPPFDCWATVPGVRAAGYRGRSGGCKALSSPFSLPRR